MKILVVGGGSGGHVTPIVAVVAELQGQTPDAEIRFWCDRPYAEQARGLMASHDSTIPVETIISGKLRRYSVIPVWRQMMMLRQIVLPNIIDGVKILAGTFQSLYKLRQWKPDVIFTKGGFVCLPVGFAARIYGIPLAIHDSDAHPGLTNRILARWANVIATGAPVENYPYPKERTHYIGIPLMNHLVPVTPEEKAQYRRELGFATDRPLIVVTGGGLGAQRINDAVVALLPKLLPEMSVLLVSGSKQYEELHDELSHYEDQVRFQLKSHISDGFYKALSAADVVVTRAGATTLLELAALGVPTIAVPNARLTGGHQVKNAKAYSDAEALEIVDDEVLDTNPDALYAALHALINDSARMQTLSRNIRSFARPDAARDMVKLILDIVKT